MKLKLFNKYFFTTASIIVFSLAIMMIILSFVLNNYIAKSRENTLSIACNEVEEFVISSEEDSKSITKNYFYSILNSVSSVAESDVFIADKNGKIIGEWIDWKVPNSDVVEKRILTESYNAKDWVRVKIMDKVFKIRKR